MNKPFGVHDYAPQTRKVKHVKIFRTKFINNLEKDINGFADDNPKFKILGVRLHDFKDEIIAIVTYLEDAKNNFNWYGDYEDGTDEERDSD